MARKNAFAGLGDLLAAFGGAIAAASAVEAGRKPQARHLRALGIDPRAFDAIGR